ncbi:hypothetical protein [Burkholderia stabilis]|nr:hypothetical protein [Burkholderia stabilis]
MSPTIDRSSFVPVEIGGSNEVETVLAAEAPNPEANAGTVTLED